MTPSEIRYTKISLACSAPLNAVEAFDEACGYRTEQQCSVISRAIQDGNKDALMAVMLDMYAAAILRNEEERDIEREQRAERADQLFQIYRDAAPAILQAQVAL